MHNDFSLLATITMAVLFAFLCGFAARKLRSEHIDAIVDDCRRLGLRLGLAVRRR